VVERLGIAGLSKARVRTAISKPDYERLELLGDTYLKWAMTHYVAQVKPMLESEGLLNAFRINLVSQSVT
jgi:dsRNA-specific ribonuclease